MIDVFELPRDRETLDKRGRGFPVPLDLTGLVVREWNLCRYEGQTPDAVPGERVDTREARAGDYLDVLDNDRQINRPLYQSIGKALRDRGMDSDAIEMHVAERFRVAFEPGLWAPGQGRLHGARGQDMLWWCQEGRWFRRLLRPHFFLDRFLFRHGVSLWGSAGLIFALFLSSFLLVASDKRNFELTPTARQLIAAASRPDSPIGLGRGTSGRDDGRVFGPAPEDELGLTRICGHPERFRERCHYAEDPCSVFA